MDNQNFAHFCQQATDRQLENILQKEYEAERQVDYLTAKAEAHYRGWTVIHGERH